MARRDGCLLCANREGKYTPTMRYFRWAIPHRINIKMNVCPAHEAELVAYAKKKPKLSEVVKWIEDKTPAAATAPKTIAEWVKES